MPENTIIIHTPQDPTNPILNCVATSTAKVSFRMDANCEMARNAPSDLTLKREMAGRLDKELFGKLRAYVTSRGPQLYTDVTHCDGPYQARQNALNLREFCQKILELATVGPADTFTVRHTKDAAPTAVISTADLYRPHVIDLETAATYVHCTRCGKRWVYCDPAPECLREGIDTPQSP